jgi:hypothetical protein
VTCELRNGAGQRTVFWIERSPAAGVADEVGDDQDGIAAGGIFLSREVTGKS